LHRILVEAAPGVHPAKTSSLGTTRRSAKLLTKDEARRIAANVAKLPEPHQKVLTLQPIRQSRIDAYRPPDCADGLVAAVAAAFVPHESE